MIKFLTKAALAATVATGLLATPAQAANSATSAFDAKAKIIKPLTLQWVSDLDFGTITMGAALTSANVVVARSGGPAASCGTNLTCSGGTPASFNVTGVALQTLNVTLGAVTPLVNQGDNTKTVAFSANPDATVTLDNLGAGSFDIGGTITVAATTSDGDYLGTVDVTVAYQ